MPSLKDLRTRIKSVKSTQRITSAMKMVAAAKLRKAQDRAESARPYSEQMAGLISQCAAGVGASAPQLLVGNGRDDTQLLIIISSDRGLCGGFNSVMVRNVRAQIKKLQGEGKQVKLITIGRKATAMLRRDFGPLIVDSFEEISKPVPTFDGANRVGLRARALFENGEVDKVVLFYTKFVSALTQIVTPQSLIPCEVGEGSGDLMEFEPDEETILNDLLPKNIAVQIFRGMLESFASEQGARMTAMDNATRNAKDMINKLTITYNRSRQAQITKELIEIISGAEAV